MGANTANKITRGPSAGLLSLILRLSILASGGLLIARGAELVGPQAAVPSVNILILGDSLGLCGFGERLDRDFRKDPHVKHTFTYMACGTTPLSWLKERPYTSVKTRCGYWAIESETNSDKPREFQDTYGMTVGYVPKAHPVPKLENLLETVKPEILVVQTGTNLFDIFTDRKTINPTHDGAVLRNFIAPFLRTAIKQSGTLKKIYWVASPTSGRVSKEVQDFVYEQTEADVGKIATVIDSRTIVSYPYHRMEPDQEHFMGPDMDQWADGVYAIVSRDLSSDSFATLPPLRDATPAADLVTAASTPARETKSQTLTVRAKLIFKSQPIPLQQLLPYQELLIAFIYEVKDIWEGQYSDRKILVMHPAYIALQHQRLGRYQLGRTYTLHVRPLEGTPWQTAKANDDSDSIDLQPYIRVQDEARYPGTTP
jgi:hypothetical protein